MPPISPFGWMTILIAAVESPAFSSTCRTAGLVSAFQTRLIAASRSGQYARGLGGHRSTAAGRATVATPRGARAPAGAGSFVAGVASLGKAGLSGANALSSLLCASLVGDEGARS